MITATATEFQNNFGHYLQAVQGGDEILILKNGKEVARLISREQAAASITDSLTGFFEMPEDFDEKKELEGALREKYGLPETAY